MSRPRSSASLEPRAGEKAYEELMTEDESARAVDLGDMFAVLPSIEVTAEVRAAYADLPSAPSGAYRQTRSSRSTSTASGGWWPRPSSGSGAGDPA